MKKAGIALLAAVVLMVSFAPMATAQEFGKIRPFEKRAAHVIRQKNDFVARVLASYQILHEINAQGAVIRILMAGRWLDVTAVEIVPILTEPADEGQRVIAHELYFFTADGILDVVSELIIR
ncbi:MAG: hypothetical protein R6W75_00015 [Smithellaceae bacterium]